MGFKEFKENAERLIKLEQSRKELEQELSAKPLHVKLSSPAVLQSITEDRPFWKNEASDYLEVFLPDKTRDTTPEEYAEIYGKLHEKMSKGLAESQDMGKKFMVVLGEDHQNRDSLVIEHMAVMIARDLGIEYLALETTSFAIKMFEHYPLMKEAYTLVMNVLDGGTENIAELLKHNSLEHVSSGDPRHVSALEAILPHSDVEFYHRREIGYSFAKDGKHQDGMVDVIEKLKDDAIGVYGDLHLKALVENMPDNTHALVLSVTPYRLIGNTAHQQKDPETHARWEYSAVDGPAKGTIEPFLLPAKGPDTAEKSLAYATAAREAFLGQQHVAEQEQKTPEQPQSFVGKYSGRDNSLLER